MPAGRAERTTGWVRAVVNAAVFLLIRSDIHPSPITLIVEPYFALSEAERVTTHVGFEFRYRGFVRRAALSVVRAMRKCAYADSPRRFLPFPTAFAVCYLPRHVVRGVVASSRLDFEFTGRGTVGGRSSERTSPRVSFFPFVRG